MKNAIKLYYFVNLKNYYGDLVRIIKIKMKNYYSEMVRIVSDRINKKKYGEMVMIVNDEIENLLCRFAKDCE